MEKRTLMEAMKLMDLINGHVEANRVKRFSNFVPFALFAL